MDSNIYEVELHKGIDYTTGLMVQNQPQLMSSQILYYAMPGDRIYLKDFDYLFAVATYSLDIPEEYMYTFMYEMGHNWSKYNGDLFDASYTRDAYVFENECYFRISLKRADGKELVQWDADRIYDILDFDISKAPDSQVKDCFKIEVQKTVDTVLEKTSYGKTLAFALMTDTHITTNGTWDDTLANVKAVNDKLNLDGIIHLGDIHDGILGKKYCRRFANEYINDICKVCEPVYYVIGNHDTNYCKGNPEWLTYDEQYALYGKFSDSYVNRKGTDTYYYVDYEDMKLRMIFLQSFNHRESIRYGFPTEEVDWVEELLDNTEEGYKVIVFSHDAPLARLDYWASEIRNGDRLVEILERFNTRANNSVMAYIHGHTHADYIYRKQSFPIISIGCNKIEYFPDKKPEGSIRYTRRLDHVSQDLWDVLVIDTENDKLDFVRFGAGADRSIGCTTKVWGHRGASGYAPENTIEAFKLAAEMKADGVELDVQLSKDGEIVVAHDETIDRVSDGTGRVCDYTLEELKQFNFNKMHPEYADVCRIPTLREVLECLQDTGLTVNIELKTGVIPYEGIEEKVVKLVHELGWQDRILYSSFNHESVKKVLEYDKKAKIAFLFSGGIEDWRSYARNNNGIAVNPSVACTQNEWEMNSCKNDHVGINVWTVNTEFDMRRLAKFGVSSLITNYPDVALKVVKEL